jgi:hypothetical protein
MRGGRKLLVAAAHARDNAGTERRTKAPAWKRAPNLQRGARLPLHASSVLKPRRVYLRRGVREREHVGARGLET